jgi:hypothetical protein
MKSPLVFLLIISLSHPSAAIVEEFLEERFMALQSQINEYCTKETDTHKQSHCFSFMLKPEVTTSLLHGEELEGFATLWQTEYAEELNAIAEARKEAKDAANQVTEREKIQFSQCTRNANAMYGSTAENNARKACFDTYYRSISFKQCTDNANSMYGSTAENNARKACAERLKYRMSFKQCTDNANAMYGSTAENNARKACFYSFKGRASFTFRQCTDNANRMYGSSAENEMRTLCAAAFR